MGRATLITCCLLVCVVLGGCSAPDRRMTQNRPPATDLLFSANWTHAPTFDVQRSDWPSTTAATSLGEVIEFRETIIDRQGWFPRQRDFYYRRFDGVRTGRITR